MQSLPQSKEYLETKSFRKGKEKFTYKNAGKSDIDRNNRRGVPEDKIHQWVGSTTLNSWYSFFSEVWERLRKVWIKVEKPGVKPESERISTQWFVFSI